MSATLSLALAALTAAPLPAKAPAGADPTPVIAKWIQSQDPDRPRVDVWVNREDPYQRGDQARVYFKSDRDAYVTILRIDTDGRMRVLFPIDPWEDNFARGDKTFEVLGRDRDEAFRVDDYPGVGYIFAIVSDDEFRYDDIVRGDHWDYRTISDGRVRGDPYVAVTDLAERIATEGNYDYDIASYDVERHYDYPRFVCYDCHTYASWHYWDPYSSYCSRFQIVIYDDWYYYPYRRYRGVYYGRPYRPGPRYVFKDSDPRNDYITRVAQRPRNGDPVRRTSADFGGRGSVPTPVSPRRRTDDPSRGATPGRNSGDEPRRRAGNGNQPDNGGGNRPDVSPEREPRRRTDDSDKGRPNQPDVSPEREPRRRTDDNNSGGKPEARPTVEPRRSSGDDNRRPGLQERLNEQRPERRTFDDSRGRDRNDRPDASSGRRPESREPRSSPPPDRGSSREPRSEPRAEPRQSSPPERRAEPRSNGGGGSKPSGGGGAPELRRRRP